LRKIKQWNEPSKQQMISSRCNTRGLCMYKEPFPFQNMAVEWL